MRKKAFLLAVLCATLLSLCNAVYAAYILPRNNVFVKVANDNGTRFAGDQETYGAPEGSYYVAFAGDGKGLNSLHMSSGLVNTTTGSATDTIWFSDTGGRGYDDDLILMISSTGPISNDFQVNIKSSGWNTSTSAYMPNALNETFGKSDFIYGAQTYRLSSLPDYPFYAGQNTNDPGTAMYFMLVDLYTGILKDLGAASSTYTISGLNINQKVAFDIYAWNGTANAGSGMNWTNASGESYLINSLPAPVPIPPAFFLFGSGLAGMFFVRRRNIEGA